MKNKYDFDDIVIVIGQKKSLKKISGNEGIIQGMVQDDVTNDWMYAVEIPKDNCIVWSISEGDLMPTNRKAKPNLSEPLVSIKVQVDPETGEGKIVDE